MIDTTPEALAQLICRSPRYQQLIVEAMRRRLETLMSRDKNGCPPTGEEAAKVMDLFFMAFFAKHGCVDEIAADLRNATPLERARFAKMLKRINQ